MSTENSLSAQLENINLSQANIVALSNGYFEALTTSKANVSVNIENLDGTLSTVVIPSNVFIGNELQRLSSSFKNLVGLTEDGRARLITTEDNQFQQIMLSSYAKSFRQPNESDITTSNQISVGTNDIIENLISPLTEVEFKMSSDFVNAKAAVVTKIVLSDSTLEQFNETMTYGSVKQLVTQSNIKFSEYSFVKPLPVRSTRYFGKFLVSEQSVNSSNQLVLNLDKSTYSDSLNIVEDSRQLEQGDKLTNSNGSLLIEVITSDVINNIVTCKFISGVGSILQNDEIFIRSNDLDTVSVKVPVRLNEQSVIFIQLIDPVTGYASPKSFAKLFDSNKFTVITNNVSSTFNEFFASKVADIGRYFEAVVKENTIPSTLGVAPAKPTLLTENFNVVPINQHLTNTPNAKKLQKLQQEKDVTNSQLSILAASITDLNSKIAKGNYSSDAKRNADMGLRQSKIDEKLQKTALLGSIVSDMSTALTNTSEQSISPKYRVRGFWEVQADIPSAVTNPQKIVQYQVRYRYVSNTGNTANSQQMTYRTENNQISASFTPWTFVKTEPLERNIDVDGNVVWTDNKPSDSDKSNINQLDIPITYGESVEIQIKAISEAGWPVSPLSSDWSDITRVDFPQSLLQESDIAAIARRNSEDILNVKIQQEFANQGFTEHVSRSFREQETYYAHELKNISSGKVTTEQKQIDALTYIESLEKRVVSLEDIVNRRYAAVTVQVLDSDLRTYDVNHFSTIKLFAGYYTEEVDLTVDSNKGSIVEKTFYLKLINRNSQTVELLSISPGILVQPTGNSQYSQVPIILSGSNEISNQQNGQIFYNRLTDINGVTELYSEQLLASSIEIVASDIDTLAQESIKNIVHFNSDTLEVVKLIQDANLDGYVAMTTSHPAYQNYLVSNQLDDLAAEFDRIKKFTQTFRTDNVQNKLSTDVLMNFDKDDKYLVGRNTLGSTLYTSINTIDSYQVNGLDTASAKELYSGDQDSILIPITFQYRMTDALGNPNGLSNFTQNTNFEYTKKIGVDLLLAGKKVTFDIQVSAKFRPSSVSNNAIGIQTIGSIGNQSPNVN